MVVAADTNLLVRLTVADDAEQHRATLRRLQKLRDAGDRVLVVTVTLAELSGVLRARYGYERAQIASVIDQLLRTPPFEVTDPGPAAAALARYRQGPAEFSDYLMLELALSAGAEKLLTFDRKLRRLSECEEP